MTWVLTTTGSALILAEIVMQVGSPSLTPYIDAGGSAALVAAIIYIAKKVSNGDLVARPVAEVARLQEERERKLAELIEKIHDENKRTIQKLLELIEDSKSREDALRLILLQKGSS